MNTSQKVVVVTGASQGTGAEIVKAKLDYRIVATARSIKDSGDDNILGIAGDIGDPTTAQRVISEAVARFGRVDTLVNNAGICIGKPFTEHTAEDYAAVMDVNVAGFFHHATRNRRDGKAFERPRGDCHDQYRSGCNQWNLLDVGGHEQGRPQRCHEVARDRVREEGHSRERRCAGKHKDAAACT